MKKTEIKGKNIAVIGGAGFIGGHLVDALVNKNNIVVIDDFSEGDYKNEKAKIINKDIRLVEDLEGIDYVFLLAAIPKVPYSIKYPKTTNSVNITGLLNILMAARDSGVKRVIFSSSSSVYGNQKTMPLNEEMKPSPLSPYGIQKLTGEFYCSIFSKLYGLETVSLRYFNVYGERQKVNSPYSAVIVKFLDHYKKKEKIPVFGGKQTRDFTYVGDVVNANILSAISENVGNGESINIGSGDEYSIMNIAEMISNKGSIDFFPQRSGECDRTKADITRAKNLLGWNPKTNLKEWINNQKNKIKNKQ